MQNQATPRKPAAYAWRQPLLWWTKNTNYLLYMIREMTAVFAAAWTVIFMLQLPLIKSDYPAWVAEMKSPFWILFSLLSLVFVLYHAWTAFNATGTLMYLRLGSKPTPPSVLNGAMFLACAGAMLVIAFIVATPAIR